MAAFDQLGRDGKVRYVGCSNYAGYRVAEALWAADRMGTARYESVQIQWSLVARDAERELVPAARQFGMGVLVWSPLAAGFLSGKYKRDEAPPKGSRLAAWKDSWAARATQQNWTTLDAVQAVAKHHGRRPPGGWLPRRVHQTRVSSG